MFKIFYLILVISLNFLQITRVFNWQIIGTGVNYRSSNLTSTNENNTYILITYAGWNVKDIEAKTWTDRLMAKSLLNQHQVYNIKHVYAVRGPIESNYVSKEIQNSKLIEHMHLIDNVKRIIIIAHSSGSFVADEFFAQLFTKITTNPTYESLRRRIVFYNLDGGTRPSRFDDTFINTLFSSIHFVWASSSISSMNSMNSATMIAAKNYYSFTYLNIKSLEVKATKAKCLNSKCLHDALIIQSPWDPNAYDTAKDYTLFDEYDREVQFEYLTLTQNELNDSSSKSNC